SHLARIDPHRLLDQERIALIEQVVGDRGHLPVPPECHDEVGASRRQHLFVVREGRRAPDLSRSFCDETAVGVLDCDQLHVWHRNQVTEVGGVVERMPLTSIAATRMAMASSALVIETCSRFAMHVLQTWGGACIPVRKPQRTVFALHERGETAQKDVWTQQSRRDRRVRHTRETQERSWFGLALGYDRRGGLTLALADADAASNAYRNESCDQSDEYFLHWSSPFFTPRDAHFVPRCTVGRSLPSMRSLPPGTVGHFGRGLCPWGHS